MVSLDARIDPNRAMVPLTNFPNGPQQLPFRGNMVTFGSIRLAAIVIDRYKTFPKSCYRISLTDSSDAFVVKLNSW